MRIRGQRYRLEAEDLRLMRVPRRFWRVTRDGIESEQLQNVVDPFVRDVHDMLDEGIGLMLTGNNGVGKTAAAVVMAKEARRVGASVFYTTAESLRQNIIENTSFDEYLSVYERARTVELLLLDDLGKEARTSRSSWSERTFENLLRERSADKLSTIITTNLRRKDLQTNPDTGEPGWYPDSMTRMLKEVVLAVTVKGRDLREDAAKDLQAKFAIR